MEYLDLTDAERVMGLRAMKAVAVAHEGVHEAERELLEVAARALGVACDVDAIAAATPEEAAAAFSTPRMRERALQAMIMMAILDGEATADEVSVVEAFARAFRVDEPRVKSLKQLAEGHATRMWVDLARHSFAREELKEALHEEGARGVWKVIGPMMGMARDPELARRFNDLGTLPFGTVGRVYWEFITKRGFGFPGEKGGVPARGVWHDLTHVLSGYDTDPEGEVQVVSFIAGYRKEDPFFWLFTIALQFHLGMKVSPYSPGGVRGMFKPERVLAAMKRGMAMNIDLSDHWDYEAVLPLSIDDVRKMYAIPPR